MSPALSDLPVRKVIRALESAGFVYARTKGSHAVYRREDGPAVVIPLHGTGVWGGPTSRDGVAGTGRRAGA
ncbi:type II toxin-antitoxin system HicA family toxin [Gandjariella thermophila]|uniref:Addiction module toxin, HicA family protein n=1 Tax=Gandjariella thermophila TaxID=1931992 RepID=A0A4D4JBT2_9PSEU|nr:type II toxin-antitoxin system HicA family toxin [Gandjariella thermophila]GDY33044.1 hypothetical protein GTS_46770 [Gandjariella thermophila]